MVGINTLQPLFVIFLSKGILVNFFLRISGLPSGVTWKPFCSYRVRIDKNLCRTGITGI